MSWKEIIWNIVNSLLAGALVFLGGCVGGKLDWQVVAAAGIAAAVVAVAKFAEYWKKEEQEYQDKNNKIFTFIPVL
jgi:hypothetical protein